MASRLITCLLAATAVAVPCAGTAAAGARPGCAPVTDARGDTAGGADPTLDLLAVRVGTDGQLLEVTFDMAQVPPAAASAGQGWATDLLFRSPRGGYVSFARVRTGAGGSPTVEAGYYQPIAIGSLPVTTAGGTAELDVRGRKIRVAVPLSAFDTQGGVRPGDTLDLLAARSYRPLVLTFHEAGVDTVERATRVLGGRCR